MFLGEKTVCQTCIQTALLACQALAQAIKTKALPLPEGKEKLFELVRMDDKMHSVCNLEKTYSKEKCALHI